MKIGLTAIFFFFCLSGVGSVYGQVKFPILYNFVDTLTLESVEDTAGLTLSPLDSTQLIQHLDESINNLRFLGYLTASIDTLFRKDSVIVAEIYVGPKFYMDELRIDEKDENYLAQNGITNIRWEGRLLNSEFLASIKEKTLTGFANRGYPFASVEIDSVIIKDNRLSGKLRIDKNDYIVYDSIYVQGNAKIDKYYLQKLLNIEKGKPYRQKSIERLSEILGNSEFLELKADPSVSFLNNKATIYIPIDNKNASKFDFIIGVLPRTINGVRNYTITGDITGQFVNELGFGETFGLRYQRLRVETQDLQLNVNYPFFLGLPFGIDGAFSLFRNTDDFLNLHANLGVEYQISSRDKIRFGWSFESSRLVAIDSSLLLTQRRLPNQLDVNVTTGTVSLTFDKLNYRFNPSKGWKINLSLNAGKKSIKPNVSITSLESGDFSFRNAYDTLNLNSFQSEIHFQGNIFFPLKNWGTVLFGNNSKYKFNQERIFENEYYRIGGNRLLRGFNEQTIFTPVYTVFTTEFRILLDQLSYISFPFIDYGYMQINTLEGDQIWDTAFGVGLGLNFGTAAGIFNISFASGSRLGEGLNFGDTKIHFGYINLF